MDEVWERAVETALDGEKDNASARTLTLDGAVKCVQGRLPPPRLLERLCNLEHLSIANVGVSTLEQFPRLWNLQKLILSDNRIAGGLEFLVEAGLDALRDLDLSNNRIQCVEDLAPLAQLKLVSLDLYECPVTRVKDYRARVFGLIKTLKYLDKMDAEENERPESDEEEDEEEEEEEDPGSGEIDGEERVCVMSNVHVRGEDGVVDVDEEEESGADEEDVGVVTRPNGTAHHNGFRVGPVLGNDVEEENDSEEEIDDADDDDVVEVYEIEDSDDDEEEDGVEYDDDDEEEEEEEVDNDEEGFEEPESSGRLMSKGGEIDGHEQGEEDGDEDDLVETGDDEMGVDYDAEFGEDDEEEDFGDGYLVQPVGQSEALRAQGGSMNGGNDDGEEEDAGDDDSNHNNDAKVLPATSSNLKRKRNDDDDDDEK